MIRLGQAEATHPLTSGKLGQVLLALRLATKSVNGIHHQTRLHAHSTTVAGINALDLASNQAIADIVHAGTAVAINGGAQQTQFTHLVHDVAIEVLVAVGLQHAWHQFFLAVIVSGLQDHALIFVKLVDQAERVFPGDGGNLAHWVLLKGLSIGCLLNTSLNNFYIYRECRTIGTPCQPFCDAFFRPGAIKKRAPDGARFYESPFPAQSPSSSR